MSAAAKLVQCQQRTRSLMDRVDEYREQWVNKQIECEQMERRLASVSGVLRERIAQTACGCGHPACRRCQDDAADRLVLREVGSE